MSRSRNTNLLKKQAQRKRQKQFRRKKLPTKRNKRKWNHRERKIGSLKEFHLLLPLSRPAKAKLMKKRKLSPCFINYFEQTKGENCTSSGILKPFMSQGQPISCTKTADPTWLEEFRTRENWKEKGNSWKFRSSEQRKEGRKPKPPNEWSS